MINDLLDCLVVRDSRLESSSGSFAIQSLADGLVRTSGIHCMSTLLRTSMSCRRDNFSESTYASRSTPAHQRSACLTCSQLLCSSLPVPSFSLCCANASARAHWRPSSCRCRNDRSCCCCCCCDVRGYRMMQKTYHHRLRRFYLHHIRLGLQICLWCEGA